MKFYLIRHGESEINVHQAGSERLVYGRNQWSELTAKGVEQARGLGERLKSSGIDAFFSSSAVRAQQTARHCLKSMGFDWPSFEVVPELTEISKGDWEGRPRSEVVDDSVQKLLGWYFRPPGGESHQDVFERAYSWLRVQLSSGHERIAVFTHENVIRNLLTGLFELDKEAAYLMRLENCSVTVIEHDGERWKREA